MPYKPMEETTLVLVLGLVGMGWEGEEETPAVGCQSEEDWLPSSIYLSVWNYETSSFLSPLQRSLFPRLDGGVPSPLTTAEKTFATSQTRARKIEFLKRWKSRSRVGKITDKEKGLRGLAFWVYRQRVVLGSREREDFKGTTIIRFYLPHLWRDLQTWRPIPTSLLWNPEQRLWFEDWKDR